MGKKIVELRTLRKDRRGFMQYIFLLRARGEIGSYVSDAGYAAYCPEEVEEYKRRAHRGRPVTRRRANIKQETEDMFRGFLADLTKIKNGE